MATWRSSGVWAVLFLAAPAASAQTHTLSEIPRTGDCVKYDLSMSLKGELRVNRDGKTVSINGESANRWLKDREVQQVVASMLEKNPTPIGTTPRYDDDCASLAISLAGIVAGIQVFEAKRTNGRYLGDVLTGLCPVEVRRIARQNDDTTGRIRLHFIAVELIA